METKPPQVVDAIFDGAVFRPQGELQLPPNTQVRLTIEPTIGPVEVKQGEPYSSLRLAASLNLEGPADFSEKLDEYLYGGRNLPE